MEDEKRQTAVYVGENDEIVEIIDKIKDIPGESVTLVIPKESVILQDVTNLKILQRQAEAMGKEISISKSGLDGLSSELRPSMESISTKVPEHIHSKGPVHNMDGVRPMSDMVKKSETIDLRNISREKNEEPIQPKSEIGESYSREKYFSDDVYPVREKKLEEFPLKEAALPLAEKALEEKYPVATSVETKAQEDEVYWEKLAAKKVAERGEEMEKFEGIFDDRGRLDTEYDSKAFDFSYPENNTKPKKKKFSVLPTISSRFFAIFIAVCVLTASLALFFILPKADIAVALKEENVKGDFNLVLDEKLSAVDVNGGKVPVKTTEIMSEKTQAFTTTSKKRVTEKARGNMVIYNECSTGPQTLVAGTRFLSKDGKVFKIEAAANVAGFTKPEDEVVAGKEIVTVVAEEAGESYNIAATSFTIPKLQEQGSWKYSCLYAKSDQPMTGGLDKEVNYVSQADYDKAKETLLAVVQKENEDKVSGQSSDDAIFLSNKTDAGTVEEKSSVAVDGVADSFALTISVKKPVLSIKKSDMTEILGKKILTLNTFESAKPVADSLDYVVSDLIDKDNQLSVDVSASQNFAFELNQDKVKRDVAGKNKQELNDYFAKMSGIKSVSVNFWPFWVSRVPESVDKISISVSSEA